ncbi:MULTISPECIES: SemiSWEET family transporter [unclassified Acinetobacter]|uniref:SemiSWEET family transporter n=1 Tax=unclassified Acinetobacter TaxID=196816 RepID=UPI0029341614|nr:MULTISPECIES: SemiSWEET family transporter [unclassified Acinetobacter]WOE31860.1 SemiSWEET family transporter [Acinetobacter sp. SAAs470]WOE37327.1 SemiSWEET family transporter [Acinetobacter sp. SAAs474]
MKTTQDHRSIQILGWIATAMAIGMYVSYIPQIINNLNGIKASPVQPLVAALSCTLWVIYGLKRKDYPIAAANIPGIIFGILTFLTAL